MTWWMTYLLIVWLAVLVILVAGLARAAGKPRRPRPTDQLDAMRGRRASR